MRPKPVTLQDLPNTPEVFLGLAGLLVLIVGAAASELYGVIEGLIMCGSALISLGFVESPLLRRMFSMLTVATVLGLLLFFQWLTLLRWAADRLETWAIFVSALLSLYAAYREILLKRF